MQTNSRFDNLSFAVFQFLLFFTPIFFVPSVMMPFQAGKTSFILYGILVIFVLWLIARLKDGSFSVPKNIWYMSSGLLALVYILATVFSENKSVSVFGQFFDIGSLAFFLPSLLLFALVPLIVKSQKQIFISYGTILASFLVIAIFHTVRFVFGVDTLSYGFFPSAASNFLGKWNDVGIFFGLVSILSLITIEKAKLVGIGRILTWIAFIGSLVMLVIVNFSLVWIVLGILTLIALVHELSFGKKEGVPFATIAVLVISAFFVFGGARVGNLVSDKLGVSQIEVRPSLATTIDLTKDSIKENFLFGSGPNRFSSQWNLHKPVGINSTIFWNTNFNYGIGFLSSFGVTLGLVGGLATLIFIVLCLFTATKAIVYKGTSNFSRYLTLSSLFSGLYLLILSIFYVPSSAIWIMTMIMLGLFVSSMRDEGMIKSASVSVLEKPTANFISVLLIIFALIGSISFGYFVGSKLMAAIYFQKANNVVFESGNVDIAESYVAKAYNLSQNDIYARYMSDIYIARLNGLFNQTDLSQAEAQQKFQDYFSTALSMAQTAVSIDNTNYLNYIALGLVYNTVAPLEIEGAYESAKQSYESALALSPENPEIYLFLARLEIANKNNDVAKEYITKALEKKNNYAEAVYMLAQVQVAEGNPSQAIASIEALTRISPNDPVVFFQLGSLYYDRERYDDATFAFKRAIELDPNYADAKYLLGMTLYLNGYKVASLNQFKELLAENPDNTELIQIVENLESGKSPRGN